MGHLIRITMVALLLARAAGAAQDPVERTDLVTKGGKPVTLVGRQPAVGDPAPTFTAVANDMSTYTFDPASGNVWIISVVPSVDTPVCSLQTKHFNDTAGALGGDVAILTVSMDLPFAQKRWCGGGGRQEPADGLRLTRSIVRRGVRAADQGERVAGALGLRGRTRRSHHVRAAGAGADPGAAVRAGAGGGADGGGSKVARDEIDRDAPSRDNWSVIARLLSVLLLAATPTFAASASRARSSTS